MPGGGHEVEWVGEMRKVMRAGDLTDHFDLSRHRGEKHLFGLGPLSGMRGEITVLDSKPYVSTISTRTRRQKVSSGFAYKAPFFVWARVESWQKVPLSKGVTSLEALGEIVEREAKAKGIDVSKPFPFQVRGVSQSGEYHVLDRRGSGSFTHADHARAKQVFPLRKTPVELLGFFSRNHGGVWTHHGETIHVHAVVAGGKGAGHVDAISLAESATLMLPSRR
jgi:acetolactate decarboxylase